MDEIAALSQDPRGPCPDLRANSWLIPGVKSLLLQQNTRPTAAGRTNDQTNIGSGFKNDPHRGNVQDSLSHRACTCKLGSEGVKRAGVKRAGVKRAGVIREGVIRDTGLRGHV